MNSAGNDLNTLPERIVYIVDDDAPLRSELAELVASHNLTVRAFGDGQSFLNAESGLVPGCVLLDYSMPGLDGLDVQSELTRRGADHSVIMLTGRGDVGVAVRAMQNGATDFLEKPLPSQGLLASLFTTFDSLERQTAARAARNNAAEAIARLTARELQVLKAVCNGGSNKAVAHDLGISMRTVEVHRANLMSKLAVRHLSDALRLLLTAGDTSLA